MEYLSVRRNETQMRNFVLALAAIAVANLIAIAAPSATQTNGQAAVVQKPSTRSGCGVGWHRNSHGHCVAN